MTLNLLEYATHLRTDLDEFADGVRHRLSACQTEESYVVRIEFVPREDLAAFDVEINESKVFENAPEYIRHYVDYPMRRLIAKVFYEKDNIWVVRNKNIKPVEEILAWCDSGQMIADLLSRKGA